MEDIKVLYVGDSGIVVGPLIFETPFNIEVKDVYWREWGRYLINALKDHPEISITYIPSIKAYRDFPMKYGDLQGYDVIMLSDVTSETLCFYPRFFPIEELVEAELIGKEELLVMPDRVELIRRFVEDGGGFVMAGGWLSFTGRFCQGGWNRTRIAEILPVKMLDVDDRVEKPMGAWVKVLNPEHPIMRGIDWKSCPPFLGYNKVLLKKGGELLAVIGENGDPLIAIGRYGKGRVMAFTSDPVLHWGINFVKWGDYGKFWVNVLNWLAGKR